MGAIAIPLLTTASTALGAYGAYRQSQATRGAYRYQAGVAANNQKIANWQARDALDRGAQAEADYARKVRGMAGSQKASLAARGLDLTVGSPLDILADTEQFGAQDLATIRTNADREAWGYKAQAANYGADAALMRARASAENPLLAGTTTLLTGAPTVAARWYDYNKSKQGQK